MKKILSLFLLLALLTACNPCSGVGCAGQDNPTQIASTQAIYATKITLRDTQTLEGSQNHAALVRQTQAALATPTRWPQDDAGSGGDTICEAHSLTAMPADEITGQFTPDDSMDCYTYAYQTPDVLLFTLSADPSLEGLFFTLNRGQDYFTYAAKASSDQDGRQVFSIGYAADATTESGTNLLKLAIGHIPVEITQGAGSSGTKSYRITVEKFKQNDNGSGVDAPGLALTNLPQAAAAFSGYVGNADECDWYTTPPLNQAEHLTVTVKPDEALDARLLWCEVTETLNAPGGQLANCSEHIADQTGPGEEEFFKLIKSGTPADPDTPQIERFGVCRQKGTAGTYTVTISLE